MTIVKQHPRVLNQLMNELWTGFPSNWGRDGQSNIAIPVNIHDSNEGYHLELYAPGRKKEDFKVNVENGLLTISFERKEESEQKDYKTIRREFQLESFKRSFSLEDKINTDGIQAKYEDGILKLFLPKKEEIKLNPKEISIQ